MYLDSGFPPRRSTMVIMEVPVIECATFRSLLETDGGADTGCLVLDCRSFFAFSSYHIRGSTNVRFSSIVRRRARAGLGLQHIVANEEARARLQAGRYRGVVFVDDRSVDFGQVKKDGTLMLAVTALRRECCSTPVFLLKGGFEAFSSQYPELCMKASLPQGLSLTLSTSLQGSASANSACTTPLYDQGGPVEILPFLYLGSAYHASRKDMLDTLGISALINVSANCPNHFEGHYEYKSIPVEDDHKADISSWFNEAIEFIDTVKNRGGRVFVHCQAGISRSATICLAYLMHTNRVKLDEAFEFVKQRRSIISPNFSFMGQLLQFESQVLAVSTCSAEAGSPAVGTSSTVFNFPVSIPVHAAPSPLSFLPSPITTSPSC
ncbi:dual specificity protein phosphatase 1 [Arapaima gigas]